MREAQDQLIHAGRMAVLGQMSRGITHELNQPLAALRTLSDNAPVLFEKARGLRTSQKNLALISQLTERMGKITGQLKAFARKSPLRLSPRVVRRALGNALALLEQRLAHRADRYDGGPASDDVEVWADANRLEQVLVNLIVNALDAMKGSAAPAARGRRRRARRSGVDRGSRLPVRALRRTFCRGFSSRSLRPRSQARAWDWDLRSLRDHRMNSVDRSSPRTGRKAAPNSRSSSRRRGRRMYA